MTIQEQKRVADDILPLLTTRWDALLAGGAPRDWFFGREARDLDFFVAGRPSKEELEEALGFELEPASKRDYSGAYFTTYNAVVGGQDVQIMSCRENEALSIVHNFPLSLSLAWYDGECHYHPHFLMTKETGVLIEYDPVNYFLLEKTLRKHSCVSRICSSLENFFKTVGGMKRYSFPNGFRTDLPVFPEQ